jgi:hypothetical protein
MTIRCLPWMRIRNHLVKDNNPGSQVQLQAWQIEGNSPERDITLCIILTRKFP